MPTPSKSNSENPSLPPLASSNELIGERLFKFKVVLINNDGRITKLRRGAIEELVIEDNILDWYHKGYLVFKNPQDFLERAVKSYKNDGSYIDMEPYLFRSDGRDYVYIEIDVPIGSDYAETTSLNSKTYTIKLMCSIYAVEDITSKGGINNKTKKIYFWDYRYQLMSEKNSYWDTSSALKRLHQPIFNRSASQLSNEDRSIHTGNAIKDIIKDTFDQFPPKFSSDFDVGSRRIFHCANAGDKVIDTLEFLIENHVSSDSSNNQPCILSLDRFTDEWSLLSIGDYYKRAYIKSSSNRPGEPGLFQQERFFLGQESTGENAVRNISKTPTQSDGVINFHNPDVGIISDYEFTEMAGFDNATLLNSTMAHKYQSGQFNINQTIGDIENTRAFFKENIVDHMLGDPKTGAVPSFIINKLRKQNKNIYNVYTGSDTTDEADINHSAMAFGRNKTLQTILFMGNTIKFNVKGMTNRRTGRFIGIDRNASYDESPFDSKLLGQYFVTSVIHSINRNGYHNQVMGVKPYYFKDLEFNESIV